jgi:predicted nucleic acid-binding protein
MLVKNPDFGKGELEAIAICKSRGYAYAAVDRKALHYAESMNIVIFPIDMILRLLWIENIISKIEVEQLIDLLAEKDKLKIVDSEKIFKDK